jgi:cytochrome c556
MQRRIKELTAGILVAAVALGSASALAVDEPANIVKYRQSTMSAFGAHMAMLGAMAKGEVSFTDEAMGHAHAIHQMSQNLDRLFPEGTGKGEVDVETRALPAIWERSDEFQQAIERLQELSQELAQLTEGGNFEQAAFARQVGTVGQDACGNCHETFREEED